MVQFYLPPKDGQPGHFWASSPADIKVTNEWQNVEFAFSIPAKGEKGWHEKMKNFRVRLDWPAEQGTLFAEDLVLEETEALDEWQSWQALGDQHSLIADPKFLNPEKDDYRLAPDSPAWSLGFQPIPVEKIGPYASPDRATWPIIEAEGAREHPLSQ
jgi:FtsP/CotA-like multicopper oxidase with cupredoxin domain